MDYYTILLGSGIFACTYFCLFPKKFKQKCYIISWYGVKAYHKTNSYILNKSKRIAAYSTLPCTGINVGQIPNTILAKNPTDIESSLFGSSN